MAKSYLADRFLDRSVTIAVPDYQEASTNGPISFSERTYKQSLEYSGLAERVTPLPPGVYRARKLHFFWTNPSQPTDIIYLRQFNEVFDRMSVHAVPVDSRLRNIYLGRSANVASRIDGTAAELVAEAVERHGFKTVSFEGLDLLPQISIFANAQRVVSPHGAGLANCLFNRTGLRILELNKPLDRRVSLRPWMFLLARGRGHHYVSLDTSEEGFSSAHIESALGVLG